MLQFSGVKLGIGIKRSIKLLCKSQYKQNTHSVHFIVSHFQVCKIMLHVKVISVLAIVILTVSQLESIEAAVVLEKAGYKFLGKVEDAESTDQDPASARGLRATYFFISEVTATHAQARKSCDEDFGGQLVKPLNSGQINDIRGFLESVPDTSGDHLWAGGRQTGTTWYWSVTGQPIASSTLDGNFANGHFDAAAHDRCLTLVGQLGNFGFCNNAECTLLLRYICQV